VLDQPAPQGVNLMAMAFTPDSKTLALAGRTFNNDQAHIYLWDVPGGQLIRRVPILVNRAPFAWLASFSPDGRLLAVGCDKIHVLDPATGALRHTLTTGKNQATALAFAHGGKLLLTADEDGTLAAWDPHTNKRLHPLATDLI
jgi:WD40 repeat protein